VDLPPYVADAVQRRKEQAQRRKAEGEGEGGEGQGSLLGDKGGVLGIQEVKGEEGLRKEVEGFLLEEDEE
jgi:hypothetical protein